jgi:hypothetical protein
MTGSGRFHGLIVFLLVLFCSVFFFQIYPHFIPTNEHSRMLLTSAIVDDHTIIVDKAIERFGDTQDKSFFNGHYYSEKAPGISILGVPVYFLLRQLRIQSDPSWYLFWLRLICVTIPSICFVIFLSNFWRRMFDGHSSTVLAFVYMFGTVAFTYSLQFISHHLTAVVLFLSFSSAWNACNNEKSQLKLVVLSGFFAGAALIMEYPTVLQVGLLFLYVLFRFRLSKKTMLFIAGLLPFVLFLLLYNYAIFGTPFDSTYRHSMVQNVSWDVPTAKALIGLTISSSRGLLFFSSILLLSIPGIAHLMKNNRFRLEGILILCIALSSLLFHAGMSNWPAGWSLGPRYLTPILPFLMTAIAYYLSAESSTISAKIFFFIFTSCISIFMITTGTITFPFPAEEIANPVFSLFVPMMIHGAYSLNIPELLGFHGFTIALLFYTTLLITFIVMCANGKNFLHSNPKKFLIPLCAIAFAAIIIFARVRYVSPLSAFQYYARSSMYFFVGDCNDSYQDLKAAHELDSDGRLNRLIYQRFLQLKQFCKTSAD